MEVAKSNLLSMAWTGVLCPLAKHADPLSWALLLIGVAGLVVSIVFHFVFGPDANSLYAQNYSYFWYSAWLILVLSTVGPVLNVVRQTHQTPLGILVGLAISHISLFLLICVYVLHRLNATAGLTALMAATATAMIVGVGWVVQHQSSARASRRSHTFAVLMQSRLGAEFQEHVRRRGELYSGGNKVAFEDAPLARRVGLKEKISRLREEESACLAHAVPTAHGDIQAKYRGLRVEAKKKHRSLTGVLYLLNFYEFICAGIVRREIDEELLWETVRDYAVALYNDTEHLRYLFRAGQPEAFVNLDRVVGNHWRHGTKKG